MTDRTASGVSEAIRVLKQFTQDLVVLGNARSALLATERGFDAHDSMARILLVVGGAAIEGAFKTMPTSDSLRTAFFKPKSAVKGVPLNRERADDMVAELRSRDLGEHEPAVRAFFEVKARRNAVVHADPSQLVAADVEATGDSWPAISAGVAGMARCLVCWALREYPDTWLSIDDDDRDAVNSVGDLLTVLAASPPMAASLLDLSRPEQVARGVLAAVKNGHITAADGPEVVRKTLAAWYVLERGLPPATDVSEAIATLAEFPASTPLRGASLDLELDLFLELHDGVAERLAGSDRARFEKFMQLLRGASGASARRSLLDTGTPDDLARAALAMMFRDEDSARSLHALRVAETCRRVLVNTTALSALRSLPPDLGGAEYAEAVRAACERVEAAHLAMVRTYEVRERARRLESAAAAKRTCPDA